ncbi:hypothetical protein [Zobellia galactanivorans]|uniref:hypothetical protein n=1 Tax=Zobellia galactanivorans (strain DSM 12802 / CCUG 47099 / CIP 106680 / NCIMB 13871 / Dsij) TaxID=63186 RepID=UPI001C072507|nr:hypothetical protein [Zobellia galactanivorans]MBU3025845.1 hypothetical protein [Zobellia galactanivorans]
MKKKAALLYLVFTSALLCVCCNSLPDDKSAKTGHPIEGVWELSHFYHLANGDTLSVDTSKVQHKIYLEGHVIWNTDPAPDASEWHGYGTYTFKNDTITETLTSMSRSMQSNVNTYVIPIERSKNTYKQVNTYERNDTVFKNIEIYKKLN